jgi:hypothetical protein
MAPATARSASIAAAASSTWLMSGEKIRDRLQAAGLVDAGGYAIVGYPKFDACSVPDDARARCSPTTARRCSTTRIARRGSRPDSTTARRCSSLYRSGKYNLIFAPHVMLFRKRIQISLKPFRVAWTGTVPERYLACPHIPGRPRQRGAARHDLHRGSRIYLGDVQPDLRIPTSAAALRLHRFHATDWQGDGNFRHWTCGKVLESADDLIAAVDEAFASHADYVAEQRRLFAYSIDLRETPSSRRGAEAILAFVRRTFPQRAMAFDAGSPEAFGQLAG